MKSRNVIYGFSPGCIDVIPLCLEMLYFLRRHPPDDLDRVRIAPYRELGAIPVHKAADLHHAEVGDLDVVSVRTSDVGQLLPRWGPFTNDVS